MSAAAVPAPRSRLWDILAILALRKVPFWTNSWPRRLLRYPLMILYALVALTLILLPFENRLAFPGSVYGSGWQPPLPELDIEDVFVPARDGNTIHGWFTAPEGWTPERGAILYSHGNGSNLSSRQGNLRRWRNATRRAVFVYDYPGYGKSTGSPSEQGGYAAIAAAHAWLLETKKVPAKEIIVLGSSMGGAFATDLAARTECRMLILINSFTNFPDMAQHQFFFLPARYVVSTRLDNESKIGSVTAPVFITHGRQDRLVPFAMGERLYERASEPKRFFPLDDHPHMHPTRPAFFAEVVKFLDETRRK